MTTTEDQIHELGRRWAEAEVRADVATLDELSADDFTLVGPAGFVLTKQQWLDRYRPGGLLRTTELEWHDVTVRDYGSAAVAVGVHTQRASYDGHPADGAFRASHVLIRSGDRWLLAGMQLSPIGGPPPFTRPE